EVPCASRAHLDSSPPKDLPKPRRCFSAATAMFSISHSSSIRRAATNPSTTPPSSAINIVRLGVASWKILRYCSPLQCAAAGVLCSSERTPGKSWGLAWRIWTWLISALVGASTDGRCRCFCTGRPAVVCFPFPRRNRIGRLDPVPPKPRDGIAADCLYLDHGRASTPRLCCNLRIESDHCLSRNLFHALDSGEQFL